MIVNDKFKWTDRVEVFEKQYHVGQGGLHLGIIKYPISYRQTTHDAYIYDCGAYIQNNIYRGIDELVEDLKEYKNFDHIRVFISHFHSDHVNGLDYLYNKLKESKLHNNLQLILPSISYYEKIFMLGHYYNNKDNNYDFSYEAFIIDPTMHFQEKYEVLYLTNENNSNIRDINNHAPTIFDTNKISDSQQYTYRNTAYQQIIWIYKTYFHPLNEEDLNKLTTEINNERITIENATKEKREKVLTIYKKYYKNINESSICLYSGPPTAKIAGWMHTGDIKLKKIIFKEFENKYKKVLDSILVFQIPHHGSDSYSNKTDLKRIKNALFYVTTQKDRSHPRRNPKIAKKYSNVIKITEN